MSQQQGQELSYFQIEEELGRIGVQIEELNRRKVAILRDLLKSPREERLDVELFGVDFLLGETGRLYLLEINQNPDVIFSSAWKNSIYQDLFKSWMALMRLNVSQLAHRLRNN